MNLRVKASLSRVSKNAIQWKNSNEGVVALVLLAVTWRSDNEPPQIEHFQNAFEAVGVGQMFR